MNKRMISRVLMVWVLIGALLQPISAGGGPTEYEVKAAFVYQFTKFVEWPSSAFSDGSSLVIGVLGDDPFGRALDDTVRGKDVNGRRLVIKRFEKLSDVQNCQVLFVSSSERKRLSGVLGKVGGQSVLTVSDVDGFAEDGGVIELKETRGRIGFEVNVKAAKRSGLKISSKLLELASAVRG